MLAVNTNLLRKNSLDSVDNESTPNSKFQLKKSGSSKKHLQQQLLSMRQISKKKVFSRDNSANIVTDTTTGNTGITGLSNTTVTAGTGVVDTPITNMLLPLQRNNKQQQASREYKFSCHGEIITKELDDNDFIRKVGKHIEWKATFDKPLEQLLYPSLQRFDTTERDKKRKIHEKIHGYSPINESNSNNKNHTTTNRTMENLLTTSSTDFTNHHNSYSNSISNSNSIDDKLFLHTPSWTAIITNNENPTTPNGSKIFTNKNIKKTLLEEIEYDGEEYLRKKLQKSYLEGNTKEKIQHRQQLYTPSIPTPSSKGNNRRGQAKNLIKAAQELETAEQLYAVMSRRSAATEKDPYRPKLNRVSVEEEAYNNQKKYLRRIHHPDCDHLFDGLLYYRMNNDLNRAEAEEKKSLERQKMQFVEKRLARKFSNTFIQRLSLRRKNSELLASGIKTASEIHAIRLEEDLNIVSSSQIEAVKAPMQSLTRLRRANDSNFSGFNRKFHSSKIDNNIDESYFPEIEKREAQDKLLFLQLDAGVLPEAFIKPSADPNFLTVDLSNYGIGDDRGVCLGKSITQLDHLQSLGLSDNRLTGQSIPIIISNMSVRSVMHIDLSYNSVHEAGAAAISSYFGRKNVLRYLDVSNCNLDGGDIKDICKSLITYKNCLEEFYLSCNKILADGANALCHFLSGKTCVLYTLDLSWNNIGEQGAVHFSNALPSNNTLINLDLASNSLGDYGGQKLTSSIGLSKSLVYVNLAQNSLMDCTAFVVSQVLKEHPSMKKLDLSLNPLGEAGARSVFRTILRGLQCFVIMRGCSYSERKNIFNNSYPGMDSPYTLDLSQPYNYAVLHELLTKVHEQPKACRMESITYHDTATNCNYNLSIKKGKLVNSNNDEFVPTTTGVIKFAFHQTVFIPTTDNIINEESLNILQVIIENGRTEGDRKQWLSLLCQDLYFTTAQAQSTISRFQNNKTIGEGGLTKLDILKSLWNILVDTENMFEFLCNNADREKRKELVFALSFKRYKFNWVNPTGYWNFNLSDKIQRSVMLQLIAINNSEAEYSRYRAGRGDTSQNGNWFNFRNEKYTTVHGITNEIRIDKDFIMNLPADGNIAFDYVSTRRPKLHNKGSRTPRYNYLEKYELLAELSNYQSIDTSTRVNDTNTVANNENSKVQFDTILNTIANAKNNLSDTNLADKVYQSMTPFSSTANSDRGNISDRSNPTSARRGITIDTSDNEEDIIEAPLITDDEFYTLMENLGLSTRYKTNSSNALYVLMDLQLASTRYYFSVENILSILDHFTDEVDIQAKVVVTMFSRIYDLYRLDIVLRSIEPKAQQEVVRRLGYLNVINPLCISFDYIFSLKYLDNRILLIELMQLASFESADNIIEHPKTELPIATLYGAYTRALNETRPETMRFTYCDFGERTINVAWATRKELLKKFLIGTTPIDRNIFKLINMYRELEYNHALSRGPIDVQYADFIKNLRSKTAHAIKANNKMVHAMKSLSVGNTSILSSNIPKITETDTDPDSAIDTSTNGGTTMKARRSFG